MNSAPNNRESEGLEPEGRREGSAAGFVGMPWITYSVIGICGVIFAYLNLAKDTSSYKLVSGMLIPPCVRMWSGAYWGLLTAAFCHLAFWHVLFNMWWTKDFGALLEQTMGRLNYLVFIVAAAMVGAGAQLAISNQTGIGFSGVVYAMFGYALAARHVEPLYQQLVNKQTIQWLLGWMVLCIVLSIADVWNVANGAHVAGFLFGYFVGNVFAARVWVVASRIGLALLVGLTVMSAVYMPWSQAWQFRSAIARFTAVAEDAARGDREAQYLHGLFLREREGMNSEALSWLRKSAKQDYVPAMNTVAWLLATDRESSLRDGTEAVKWAEAACQQDNWKTAAYVDTLAAAYAEGEKWEEAVATQKRALGMLTGGDAKEKPSFESRLQQYLKKEKVRE